MECRDWSLALFLLGFVLQTVDGSTLIPKSSEIRPYLGAAQALCINEHLELTTVCGSNSSKWIYDSEAQTLQNEVSQECLSDSSYLDTTQCDSSDPYQKWNITADNERITNGKSSKCLYTHMVKSFLGTSYTLKIEPCADADEKFNWNQQFVVQPLQRCSASASPFPNDYLLKCANGELVRDGSQCGLQCANGIFEGFLETHPIRCDNGSWKIEQEPPNCLPFSWIRTHTVVEDCVRATGAYLAASICNADSSDQKWAFDLNTNMIRNDRAGKCLSVDHLWNIALSDCDSSQQNQQWKINERQRMIQPFASESSLSTTYTTSSIAVTLPNPAANSMASESEISRVWGSNMCLERTKSLLYSIKECPDRHHDLSHRLDVSFSWDFSFFCECQKTLLLNAIDNHWKYPNKEKSVPFCDGMKLNKHRFDLSESNPPNTLLKNIECEIGFSWKDQSSFNNILVENALIEQGTCSVSLQNNDCIPNDDFGCKCEAEISRKFWTENTKLKPNSPPICHNSELNPRTFSNRSSLMLELECKNDYKWIDDSPNRLRLSHFNRSDGSCEVNFAYQYRRCHRTVPLPPCLCEESLMDKLSEVQRSSLKNKTFSNLCPRIDASDFDFETRLEIECDANFVWNVEVESVYLQIRSPKNDECKVELFPENTRCVSLQKSLAVNPNSVNAIQIKKDEKCRCFQTIRAVLHDMEWSLNDRDSNLVCSRFAEYEYLTNKPFVEFFCPTGMVSNTSFDRIAGRLKIEPFVGDEDVTCRATILESSRCVSPNSKGVSSSLGLSFGFSLYVLAFINGGILWP